MSAIYSWIGGLLGLTVALVLAWIAGRLGTVLARLDRLAEELARLSGRVIAVERQINDYWRGVEERVGNIHETFESGRACRVGATIAEIDSRMGHVNRKMTELLESLPRSARGSEDT